MPKLTANKTTYTISLKELEQLIADAIEQPLAKVSVKYNVHEVGFDERYNIRGEHVLRDIEVEVNNLK